MRLFFLLCLLTGQQAGAQLKRYQFTEPKMGSPFHLVFYAPDSATAVSLARLAFARIDQLNKVYSDYDDSSELNRLSRKAGSGQSVPLSPELYAILLMSQKASAQSRSAYDITIGPLSRLWRQARRQRRFPLPSEVQEAKSRTGMQHLILDTVNRTAQLRIAGMQLDLGGIAKGYIAQAVVDLLRSRGITSVLADAGGDIVCSGPPPDKEGWTIGINVPGQEHQLLGEKLQLAYKAVATSGDVYQYTEHKGKRYSHIINPKTGYGVTFQRNVTVIAPDGATADWLATACSILPIRRCKRLVRQQQADLLITQLRRGKIRYHYTRGMKSYLRRKFD